MSAPRRYEKILQESSDTVSMRVLSLKKHDSHNHILMECIV